MSIFDLSNVIYGVILLLIFIVVSVVFGIIWKAKKDIEDRMGKKLSDSILVLGSYIIDRILFLPRSINKYQKERKIAGFLKDQIIILADSDRNRRLIANQQIINYLSDQLGCEAAVKWKIDRILIQYLTSDCEDTKRFAIENLEQILDKSDYYRVISSELIKALISNLSEESEIREQSKKLLHRIIVNHFSEIFVDSIDSGISELCIIRNLIELLQHSLEIEENNIPIQLKVFSLLNFYLHSTDNTIKNQVMKVLENGITVRNSRLIIDIGIIPQLLELLKQDNISGMAHRVLIKIGQSALLPQIIQISRSRRESLPKKELSCLIFDTITSNDFSKLIEIDVLNEIFEYLSDTDIQTKSCATDSLIRFLYMSNHSAKKKNELLQRLTALNIGSQITIQLSSDNLDVFYCGLRILQQLIRIYGKNTVVTNEIVNTLVHCCLNDSIDIRLKAFQMIEDLNSPPDIVINYLCRLGLDEHWQDRIADKLAAMIYIYKKIPILNLIDNFGSSLNSDERIEFTRLKQKIADQLKISERPDERGLSSFSF